MIFRLLVCSTVVAILGLAARVADADALARLKPDRLAAVHAAVEQLAKERQDVDRAGPYRDYRANLHVHSAFSHDSRGTIDEIVAAAKAAGTQVLMFTEHPADHYDFFRDGHQGIRDGVLLIPGAEMRGFLVFPTLSLKGLDGGSPQELCDLVRGKGGHMFVSHLEERMEWSIEGVTGVEIYNTHADFKTEKNLIAAMRNPLWLFGAADLFRKYPQESLSALQDYPADYLKRWDELCQIAPHTGVSANDSHQNVGLVLKLLDDGKVRFEDALGEKLFEIEGHSNPALTPLLENKQPGDTLFELRLDPYARSLRHVGTHLLMKELKRDAVWEALEAGRAYVAFDWIANATGFDFAASSGTGRYEMGSRVPLSADLKLTAEAPLPVSWRLIRSGELAAEGEGRTFDFNPTAPGTYRIEAWLDVAGEKQIWILSNPLYVGVEAK